MALDPLLQRLVQITYKTDFAQLHLKSHDEVRRLVKTHHSLPQAGYYDVFTLPNGCEMKFFRPEEKRPTTRLPLVFYGRGCGGIAPEPNEAQYYCSYLAKRLNAYIATPDFRLAPEYKFPVGLYDGLAALKWTYANCDRLNFDPKCFVVWGESSGANALTVSCQLLRDEKLDIVKHQTLLYPTTDMFNSYPSKEQYQTGYLLEVNFLNWLLDNYLNHPDEKSDFRVSPLLNPDLSNLPQATIITAECDPTRDEAEAYAAKLKAAGCDVSLQRFDSMTHGFVVYYKRLKQAQRALDFACNELLEFFKHNQDQPTPIA